jgi:outer membrane protein assembly factor BamB
MRTSPPIPLLLVLALAPLLVGQAPEWPGFRGPHGTGVAAEGAQPPKTWSSKENVLWTLDLPGPGSSSPIIVGERIYLTCYSGYGAHLDDGGEPSKLEQRLLCVDRAVGSVIWEAKVPTPLEKDARQVQIKEHGFASPTPVSDGKNIYWYMGHAGVIAVDPDGKTLWKTDLGEPSEDAPPPTNSVVRNGKALSLRWGSAASPILHDGLVIVNASEQSNSVRALDQKTGALVWKRESSNLEGSAVTPRFVGEGEAAVLIIALADQVWGLHPKTGELHWTVENAGEGGLSSTPVTDGKLVYAFAGEKTVAARPEPVLPTVEGESEPSRVVWKGEGLDIISPVLHGGRLFLVRSNGIGLCLNAADGKVLFNERLEGRTTGLYASPVLADGRIYVVSRKRGTFVYSADGKFTLIARNELDDDSQFNATPAIVGKTIFLRSDRRLYCISG